MKAPLRFTAALCLLVVGASFPPAAPAQWECPEVTATEASCGQSICPEDGVQTADALKALRAAVGAAYCAPCRCDVDANGSVTVRDAIRILIHAVGSSTELQCAACNSLALHPVEISGSQSTVSITTSGNLDGVLPLPLLHLFGSLELPDGRTALLGRPVVSPLRTQLVILDENDEVVSNVVLFDGVYVNGSLNCGAGTDRCVISWKARFDGEQETLRVTMFNLDAVDERGTIAIKQAVYEGEGLYEISTGASAASYSCDASGVCVSAWLLARTTIYDQDQSDTEALGYHARAFNVRTGEVGPEVFLADSDVYENRSPFVASLGNNRFRLSLQSGDVFEFEVR